MVSILHTLSYEFLTCSELSIVILVEWRRKLEFSEAELCRVRADPATQGLLSFLHLLLLFPSPLFLPLLFVFYFPLFFLLSLLVSAPPLLSSPPSSPLSPLPLEQEYKGRDHLPCTSDPMTVTHGDLSL